MMRSDNYRNLRQPETVCVENSRTRAFMEKFYLFLYIGVFAIVFPLLRLCFLFGFIAHVIHCYYLYKYANRTVELTLYRHTQVTVTHETCIHILLIILLAILVYYVVFGIWTISKFWRFIKRNRLIMCFNGQMKMACVYYSSSALTVYLLLAVILSDDTIARLITFSLTTVIVGIFEFASYAFLKHILKLSRGSPVLPQTSPLPSILRRSRETTVVDVEVDTEAENNGPRPNGLENNWGVDNEDLNTENRTEEAKSVKRVRFACDVEETTGSSENNGN